ncbi:translation initiation factor IF-2 N-terminal domain-containing protein, partial [Streptococcus sp. DD10]|uniref:translation initiation factor IF-2 N-terminal domain-containing protein n=1 Tax=Streptococcus sp. DD10 TaxID=1777878 RepID=UPI001E3C2821
MSKKRLYEIARELGKESKEVVARAKELGIEVKSHSSSVEVEVASQIVASFSVKKSVATQPEVVKPESSSNKIASRLTQQTAEQTQTSFEETKSTGASNKPQSRNFKAEREARAKEQAERRKNT